MDFGIFHLREYVNCNRRTEFTPAIPFVTNQRMNKTRNIVRLETTGRDRFQSKFSFDESHNFIRFRCQLHKGEICTAKSVLIKTFNGIEIVIVPTYGRRHRYLYAINRLAQYTIKNMHSQNEDNGCRGSRLLWPLLLSSSWVNTHNTFFDLILWFVWRFTTFTQ